MAVADTQAPTATTSVADKLREVCVGMRLDLEVSRHLFRGEPFYIVRDPLTFQCQRLRVPDYIILSSIRSDRSLGNVFDSLVVQGHLTEENENDFYQFIVVLHRQGFLHLPVSDSKMLYRRFQMLERHRRRNRLMGMLFLRIPLINPSAFLDRTIDYVRPLLSVSAFVVWLTLMIAAGIIAWNRFDDLMNPLNGVLVASNLPIMWVTLIVLKVFHEFGHAYVCRNYDGHVPEMGIYLILFTPCAYVDATASWGFSRRRHRLYVCLAGMYVEGAIAAVAMFVWASTEPSWLHAMAYNIIFLAGIVTVLFNINPLMRYDGYYILSDIVEIPNLRARSIQYLKGVLKRISLGVRSSVDVDSRRVRAILGSYGVATVLYRASLMVAIAAVLATKLHVVGLAMGVLMLSSMLASICLKLTSYLWYSPEVSGRRFTAVALSLVLLLLLPAGVMWIPMTSSVRAAAIVTRENVDVVRVRTPGIVKEVHFTPGSDVQAGERLADLTNSLEREQLLIAEANLERSDVRCDAYRVENLARFAQESQRLEGLETALAEQSRRVNDLIIRAPSAGQVVDGLRPEMEEAMLNPGVPVATIASGGWLVRAVLTEADIAGAKPKPGDHVQFRAYGLAGAAASGTIVRVAPTGSRHLDIPSLTHLAGGKIAVSERTHDAAQPYFEIVAKLDKNAAPHVLYGMTGFLYLEGSHEPIGTALTRHAVKFWNKLKTG